MKLMEIERPSDRLRALIREVSRTVLTPEEAAEKVGCSADDVIRTIKSKLGFSVKIWNQRYLLPVRFLYCVTRLPLVEQDQYIEDAFKEGTCRRVMDRCAEIREIQRAHYKENPKPLHVPIVYELTREEIEEAVRGCEFARKAFWKTITKIEIPAAMTIRITME